VTPPLFQWSVPLVAGGICMVIAPLWMFGTPDAAGGSLLSARQLGLTVVLYYPSAIAMLFIVSRLHRLVTRKAERPRIDLRYLTAANICLMAAVIAMIAAVLSGARP
jgi:hypothetical protein